MHSCRAPDFSPELFSFNLFTDPRKQTWVGQGTCKLYAPGYIVLIFRQLGTDEPGAEAARKGRLSFLDDSLVFYLPQLRVITH